MAEPIKARFFDGKSARAHDVLVRVEADGLDLAGDTASRFLPFADLKILSQDQGEIRLTLAPEPDLRLVAPLALADAMGAHARAMVAAAKPARRMAVLIGSLVLGSALIAVTLFVGVPMAAEPLARATPKGLEETLGRNFSMQLTSLMPLCRGPAAEDAKEAIAPLIARLQAASNTEFEIQLEFNALAAPNALALPGGRVQVTEGLLETLESSDELAAVIAHEIGHVEARDGLIGLYRHMGLAMMLDIIVGGSGLAQQAVILSGQIAEMRHSRDQETRADEAAIRIMTRAGYDPAALARAFKRLDAWVEAKEAEREKEERKPLEMPEWFASHPDTAARIAAAEKATIPDRPQPLSLEDWAAVKRACTGEDRPRRSTAAN